MKFNKCFIVIFFFISYSATAQVYTWTGNAGSTNWHNAMNWDLNEVPNSTSIVTIPANFNVDIVNAEAFAYSILINPTATLSVENNLAITQLLTIAPNANYIWKEGTLTGGLIENDGVIRLETNTNKDLYNATIINRGETLVNNSGLFRLFNNITINNEATGSIIINSPGGIIEQGNSLATINNNGLIEKPSSVTSGAFYMITDMNNSGVINVGENQIFLFLVSSQNLTNYTNGVMKGSGTFDITANLTNNGIVSPGDDDEIGQLDIVNNFSLDASSKLVIDINGINSEDFDKVDVFGGPSLNGNIDINLNYEPSLGDEYIVLTSNFTLSSCNLPSQVITSFNGFDFTFDVICNTNDVTLRVNNITLSLNEFNDNLINFHVVPNPVDDISRFVLPQDLNLSSSVISIHNMLGQEVISLKASNEMTNLNNYNLTSGIYIAQLKDESNVLAITKFIIR